MNNQLRYFAKLFNIHILYHRLTLIDRNGYKSEDVFTLGEGNVWADE